MENNQALIDAVKSVDLAAVKDLIASGAEINCADEQGWTPLNFAAGKGDLAQVTLLVEAGADVFKVGRDNRTPYMIALAAGRADVATYLREIENKTDPERAKSFKLERNYCRAYYLSDLRKFPTWSESRINWKEEKDLPEGDKSISEFSNDKIVYLHQDLTVTESMWHNENVIFRQLTDDWRDFCARDLAFRVPDDLELIAPQMDKA